MAQQAEVIYLSDESDTDPPPTQPGPVVFRDHRLVPSNSRRLPGLDSAYRLDSSRFRPDDGSTATPDLAADMELDNGPEIIVSSDEEAPAAKQTDVALSNAVDNSLEDIYANFPGSTSNQRHNAASGAELDSETANGQVVGSTGPNSGNSSVSELRNVGQVSSSTLDRPGDSTPASALNHEDPGISKSTPANDLFSQNHEYGTSSNTGNNSNNISQPANDNLTIHGIDLLRQFNNEAITVPQTRPIPEIINLSDDEDEIPETVNSGTLSSYFEPEIPAQERTRPAATQQVDSDDDEIMILDPAEANRTGLFNKPRNSFHRPIITPVPPSQRLQANYSGDPVVVDNNPTAIASAHHNSNMMHMLELESRSLLSRATYLRSICDKLTKEIPVIERRMYDTLERIQHNEMRATSVSDPILTQNLEGENRLLRTNFVSQKTNFIESNELLNSRKIERDNVINSLRELNERRRRLQEQVFSPMAHLNSIQQLQQANSQSGYATNIYSTHNEDAVDLQDLLNNIKPLEKEEEGMEMTPPELAVTLLKHQRIGLSWMVRMESNKSKGGILADDMGLGKTVQAIALMMKNRSEDENCKTNLIIGPVSLLRQWAAEIESKIKPGIKVKVGIFHGSNKKAMDSFRKMKLYDVVMTSYGTLSSEFKKHYKSPLESSKVTKDQDLVPDIDSGGTDYSSPFFTGDAIFYRIILDEAQNIKNKLAITSKAVACLKGKYRFCLSGTPMQNNVDELYPLLRFLAIRPYNDLKKFSKDISAPIKSKSGNYDEVDRGLSLRKLRALLSAILLRRTKDSKIDGKPLLTLPTKHLHKDFVKMDSDEKKYYETLEGKVQEEATRLLNTQVAGGTSNILTLLLRLRQACVHRFLVEIGIMNSQEKNADPQANTNTDWATMYSKVVGMLDRMVEQIKFEVHNGSNNEDQKPIIEGDNLVNPDNVDDENLFSCPLCLDVVGYESIVLFAGCGHMICSNCIGRFFEDRDLGDGNHRLASCMTCERNVKDSDLIDYNIFHKVHHEGYDLLQMRQFYGHASTGKTTVSQKLLKLILENDGFVPSAKMERTVELVKEIFEKYKDEKVIIFSQFTVTFDLLKLLFRHENIPFLRYDGSMSIDAKNNTIKDFYQSDTKVLMLSLRAGNVGLTLTCASHVIILDPFWNPFVEEQAMDRAYRIGQQREVHVHRILIEGTVENRIMDLQDKKKELISAALDEKGMQGVSRLGRRELGFLFGLNSLE